MSIKFIHSERGVALIAAYFVIAALTTIGIGFVASGVNELNQARIYKDSVSAFWAAEEGISEAVYNLRIDPNWGPGVVAFEDAGAGVELVYSGDGTPVSSSISIDRTTHPSKIIIESTGQAGSVQRQIQTEMPWVNVFSNTIAAGGNMQLSHMLNQPSRVEVFGPTRLTGQFIPMGDQTTYWFDELHEDVSEASITTITYPDSNANGTADEFSDFKTFYQTLLATYPQDQVVYIQVNGTAAIWPNNGFIGKKIVYVEGANAGQGNVNILFGANWQDGQDLTIISTGNINYSQPLETAVDSRLSTISWSGYSESGLVASSYHGITYTHGTADYVNILGVSESTGNVIANAGISEREINATKKFIYSDEAANGNIPPGFEGLVDLNDNKLSEDPVNWIEEDATGGGGGGGGGGGAEIM